jgi:23S rRNA (uracil1939-C5)-methyltransferase
MSGCRVNARALTALARTLSALWSRAGLPIFQEGGTGKGHDNGGRDLGTDRGGLRYVLLREVRSGALQLSLVLGAPLPDGDARLQPLLSELRAVHPALASVVLHINASRGNSLLVNPSESGESGGESSNSTESGASARTRASEDSYGDPLGPEESDRELLGSSYLWEELSGPAGLAAGPPDEEPDPLPDPLTEPLRLRVSARSFLQVNRALAARLYSDVARALRVQPGESVLDLYCGVSGLGRTVLRTQPAARLIGIEWSASAIADARASAESSTEPAARAARFLCGGVAERLPEVLRELSGTAAGPAVVLLNPPRRGCEPAVLEALVAAAPRAIGYVSCNPHSLARDLRTLIDAGYRPTSITPYDMHPGTPHIETVTILKHIAGPTPR